MSAPVTVAVVSWNTRDLLSRCLRSLEPDARSGLAEVWVVDNGSTDGSAELVRHGFEWVHLVEADNNLGFGPAVNLVAARTAGPWLVAANADVAVTSGAIARLVAAGEAHPAAAALAPRLVRPGGATQHSAFSFPSIWLSLVFASRMWRLNRGLGDRLCIEGAWDFDRERPVPWAVGAFLLLRRAAFEHVGGFDERQWMYAEDLDLGWRIARAGLSTHYTPDAHVHHQASAATAAAFGSAVRARQMAASYLWLVRRRGTAVARTFALVNLTGALPPLIAALLRSRRLAVEEYLDWMRVHGRGLRDPAAGVVEQELP